MAKVASTLAAISICLVGGLIVSGMGMVLCGFYLTVTCPQMFACDAHAQWYFFRGLLSAVAGGGIIFIVAVGALTASAALPNRTI